jgi:hypothetical protein
MATKKKPDGLIVSEMSMNDLAMLHCRCEAVFAEAMFGWVTDRQIDKIGKNAKQAIEYKIGEDLTINRARRKAIENELRKPYLQMEDPDAMDDALRDDLRKNKEFMELIRKEADLWEVKIADFEFVPVKVKITNAATSRLKKDERAIVLRDRTYNVEVYAALGYLVDNGYLIETT